MKKEQEEHWDCVEGDIDQAFSLLLLLEERGLECMDLDEIEDEDESEEAEDVYEIYEEPYENKNSRLALADAGACMDGDSDDDDEGICREKLTKTKWNRKIKKFKNLKKAEEWNEIWRKPKKETDSPPLREWTEFFCSLTEGG
ncbi:unnamed protein product [Blepharisma stoltei]|uniref:Uncharacterized protein n=1 Tax=Blepharisma stoltei TaxID=1481888 RepID=A0AAU9J464_9CILI|nr:unnamed protein product [Blepharisma stoltei]